MPHPAHPRRLGRFVVPGLLALIAVACSRPDERLATLTVGMSKDSVLQVMGGPGERPVEYLVEGQHIQAILYRRPGTEGPIDSLERRQLTPVVLVDQKLTGWTWEHWDSLAGAHRIEVTPAR